MKTTIDISDALLSEARRVARQNHLTLRSLVEQGLRNVLNLRSASQRFTLKKASFKGNGVQDEFAGANWEKVRNAAYEDHGT